jgi:hypothetical protein
LGACFLIFLEKIKKQAPKKHIFVPNEPLPGLLPPPAENTKQALILFPHQRSIRFQ